jgi:eukaryotic-like serine/threonine-protein kinase
MGQVFLGSSPGGHPVAVKVIHPELAGDPQFRALFRHEVRAAQSVSGSCLVPVIDAGAEADTLWLATGYVPGPDLGEAVREQGPLTVRAVRRLGTGLAGALAAIHGAGLVHRDLKPANVLLAEDGPRVADFAMARALEASSLTVRHALGTPQFMAPEQAEGGLVGPATDIFSLGGLLVFAVTGAGPFGEGHPAAVLYRVVYAEPDLSAVPGMLAGLVARCLAKDPRARPCPAEIIAELGLAQPDAHWLPGHILDFVRTHAAALPAAAATDPAHRPRARFRRASEPRHRHPPASHPEPPAATPGQSPPAGPAPAGRGGTEPPVIRGGIMPPGTLHSAPPGPLPGASPRIEEILGRAATMLVQEGKRECAALLAQVCAVRDNGEWLILVVPPDLEARFQAHIGRIEHAIESASELVPGTAIDSVYVEPEAPEFDRDWRSKLSD